MDMLMFTEIGVLEDVVLILKQQGNTQHFDHLFLLFDRTCWLLKAFIKPYPLHTLIIIMVWMSYNDHAKQCIFVCIDLTLKIQFVVSFSWSGSCSYACYILSCVPNTTKLIMTIYSRSWKIKSTRTYCHDGIQL